MSTASSNFDIAGFRYPEVLEKAETVAGVAEIWGIPLNKEHMQAYPGCYDIKIDAVYDEANSDHIIYALLNAHQRRLLTALGAVTRIWFERLEDGEVAWAYNWLRTHGGGAHGIDKYYLPEIEPIREAFGTQDVIARFNAFQQDASRRAADIARKAILERFPGWGSGAQAYLVLQEECPAWSTNIFSAFKEPMTLFWGPDGNQRGLWSVPEGMVEAIKALPHQAVHFGDEGMLLFGGTLPVPEVTNVKAFEEVLTTLLRDGMTFVDAYESALIL